MHTFANDTAPKLTDLDAALVALAASIVPSGLGLYSAKAGSCVGDGVTPDGNHMNGALSAASECTLMAPDQYLLDVPVNIPPRTTLSGAQGNPSQPALGESVYARKSLLNISQAAVQGVILNRGSVLQRASLTYAGLPAAPTNPAMGRALVAAMAGTGINVLDADASIEDMFIGGFQTGITVYPNSNAGSGSRFRMRNVRMDTINGIFCTNQFDVPHISDVEMWPFLFVDINGMVSTDYVRNGYGLYLQGGYDSGLVEDVFCFGKSQSFVLDNVRAVTMVNCLADSADGTTPNNPTALTITNNCWGHQIYNFRCESQHLGLSLDTSYTGSPTEPTATFYGGRMNSNGVVVQINRGNYQFIGCTFGNSGSPCINISAQAGNIDIIKPVFLGSVTQPIVIDAAYTGHISILLSGPQAPNAGFVGSSIPQSLIESGQVNIMMADLLDIEQDIMTRPLTNVGPQPVVGFYSPSAPTNQRNIRWTTGSDGSLRAQLLNDAGTAGRGDMFRIYTNSSGVSGFGSGVLPQYASDAAAKSSGLVIGDWYYNGSANVQIRS